MLTRSERIVSAYLGSYLRLIPNALGNHHSLSKKTAYWRWAYWHQLRADYAEIPSAEFAVVYDVDVARANSIGKSLGVTAARLRPPIDPLAREGTRGYDFSMTQAVVQILEEAQQLSPVERAELADRLVETLADEMPPEIARAQLDEVKRRVAEVEAGAVKLVPGDQALAEVRRIVEAARSAT